MHMLCKMYMAYALCMCIVYVCALKILNVCNYMYNIYVRKS